jgi:cytochrome b subunit of formate dehydrogenase
MAIIVTILYPVLDFILIIPSSIILITLRKDYEHNIPWFLSSLSLLVNSIADDGYVNDFVTGNSENLWFWELFYITDFIIISGALFWYNRFHISNYKKFKNE